MGQGKEGEKRMKKIGGAVMIAHRYASTMHGSYERHMKSI